MASDAIGYDVPANRAGDPYGLTTLGQHGWADVTRYDRPAPDPDSRPREQLRRAARDLEDTRAAVTEWHNSRVGLLASALGPDSPEYTESLALLQAETTRRSDAARDKFNATVSAVLGIPS